jgi:hypothetical protein
VSDIRPEERVLDWIPVFDARSLDFKVSAKAPLVTAFTKALPRNRRWSRRAWLDQGREGACTGFGAAHVLAATPRPHSAITHSLAQQVYYEAQHRDEWPGNDYEGSSVNGAMKALRDMHLISEWWWCTTRLEIDAALSHYGQVEIGVDWTSGMFNPDSEGFISHTGQVVGGHALALAGRRKMPNGRVRYELDQSWGRDHGIDGTVFLWEDTLEWWLSRDSEFALPRKVKP